MIIEIGEDERAALAKVISEASWGRTDERAAPALAEFARLDEHEEKALGAFLKRLHQRKAGDDQFRMVVLVGRATVLETAARDFEFANVMCSCSGSVARSQAHPGPHHLFGCVLYVDHEVTP